MSRAISLHQATSATTADTTTTVSIGTGAHNASQAKFYIDVTAASSATTSTWQIDLYAVTPDGNNIAIAQATGLDATTTSVTEIPLLAAFTNSTDCIPMPDEVLYTRSAGTGTLTGRLIAFAAKD